MILSTLDEVSKAAEHAIMSHIPGLLRVLGVGGFDKQGVLSESAFLPETQRYGEDGKRRQDTSQSGRSSVGIACEGVVSEGEPRVVVCSVGIDGELGDFVSW